MSLKEFHLLLSGISRALQPLHSIKGQYRSPTLRHFPQPLGEGTLHFSALFLQAGANHASLEPGIVDIPGIPVRIKLKAALGEGLDQAPSIPWLLLVSGS
jgi:hypothetical protein